MRLETPNLILLPMTVMHVQALMRDRDRFKHMIPFDVPDSWPWEETMGALPFIETELKNAPERLSMAWMFVHKKDRRIIGEGGISPKADEFHAALIGYHVIPEYRNKGYGFEATRSIVDYALTHPSVKVLRADTLKDGWASIRILQKLGFEKEGESDLTLHWQRRL